MVAFCTSCPNPSLEPGTQDEVMVSTIYRYINMSTKPALYLPVFCMACHGAQLLGKEVCKWSLQGDLLSTFKLLRICCRCAHLCCSVTAMVAFCTSCPNPSLEPGTQDEVMVSTIYRYINMSTKPALYLPVFCMACHGAQLLGKEVCKWSLQGDLLSTFKLLRICCRCAHLCCSVTQP